MLKDKHCCTVCDGKKKCHVCSRQTLQACSDCRIDFGVSVYVCEHKQCMDAHQSKCSHALRDGTERLQKALFEVKDVAEDWKALVESLYRSGRQEATLEDLSRIKDYMESLNHG